MALNEFLKLAVSINGKTFHLASLSFNENKKELFYNFTFILSKIVQACHDGEWKGERMWEHVSYHSDGRVHLKYRDLKKNKEYTNIIDGNPNIFEFKEDLYFSLLINSFFFEDFRDTELFPQLGENEKAHVWDISAGKNFSFIPVIVGRKVSPATVAKGLDFLIDKSQKSVFCREPLRKFNSPLDLNQPPSTSSLCILFSDKVSPRESQVEELATAKLGKCFASMSLGIAPPLHVLRNMK